MTKMARKLKTSKVIVNDDDDIKSRIVEEVNNNYIAISNHQELKNINVLENTICIAIKTNREKCTQKVKDKENLCNRHYNLKIKKGNILTVNDTVNSDILKLIYTENGKYTCQVNEKKKRGRRRKYEISPNFYDDDYITVWPEIVEGQKLFVDNNDNVYTFDVNNPKYLGKKTLLCKIVK